MRIYLLWVAACLSACGSSGSANEQKLVSIPAEVSQKTQGESAPKAASVAEVRAKTDHITKVAPHGKARVTELARGQNAWLGVLELDAEVKVPEHQDQTEETLYVLSGGGTVTIDGVSSEIAAGDSVMMPAGATVTYKNGPEPLRVIQVFAGPEPAAKYDAWSPAP